VVEGSSDVMALSTIGLPSVAILGSYISNTQSKILELLPKTKILWGDGDGVGESWVMYGAERFGWTGFVIENFDPAEAVKEFSKSMIENLLLGILGLNSFLKFDENLVLVEEVRFDN